MRNENTELAKETLLNAATLLRDAGIESKRPGRNKKNDIITEYHGLGFYLFIGCSKKFINRKKGDLIQIQFEHKTVYDGFGTEYYPGPWENLLKEIVNHMDIAILKQAEYLSDQRRALSINQAIGKFMLGLDFIGIKENKVNDEITVKRNDTNKGSLQVVYKGELVYSSNYFNEIELLVDGPWEEFIVNYEENRKQAEYNKKHAEQLKAVDKYMLELKNN